MTGLNYETTPKGNIVNKGAENVIVNEKIISGANVKAGMLVVLDSNDYKAKLPSDTTIPVGWAGYEQTNYANRPATIDTAYSVGDVAGIISGGGFELWAFATGSTSESVTITIGDYLTTNSDGTLTKYSPNGTVASTTATNPYPPVAIAKESVTIAQASTAKVVRIHVQSLI